MYHASLFSAKDLTDVNGNKYEFTVCEGVSGQPPDVGMVMTKSGNKPVVLGKNSRALVSSQGELRHLCPPAKPVDNSFSTYIRV